jgi:hypothetical protein
MSTYCTPRMPTLKLSSEVVWELYLVSMSTNAGRDRWAKRLFRRADGTRESSSPSPSGKNWPTAFSHHVIVIGQSGSDKVCLSLSPCVTWPRDMGLQIYDHVQGFMVYPDAGL